MIYYFIFLSSVLAIISKYKAPQFYSIVKPIPIILLLLQIYFSSNVLANQLLLFGLIFSLLGDLSLLRNNLFYLGLLFFLTAHILYFSLFIIFAIDVNWILVVPFIFYSIILFSLLNLASKITSSAIILYMSAISLMGFSGLNLYLERFDLPSLLIFLGGLLFILSDSVLAYNKFKSHFKVAEIVILSTYYLAQTLIVIGVIKLCA